MSLPVTVSVAAQEDVAEIRRWYNDAGDDLTGPFDDELVEILHRIEEYPQMYARHQGETRLAPFAKFPYVVAYRVGKRQSTVLAVYHGSRHPSTWRKRL